jgi:hypothetical protein
MKELVFLLEEDSAKAFLESVLPRIINQDIAIRLIPFEGKQDLEKQITKKIRGYSNPNARFIVMRDQDSHPDGRVIKESLMQKCIASGKAEKSLIRIACKELESFYLADLAAVESALELDGLAKHQSKAKFRAPDNLQNPSKELSRLTNGQYQKVSHSRLIGQFINPENNRSTSFWHLITGIRRLEAELLTIQHC